MKYYKKELAEQITVYLEVHNNTEAPLSKDVLSIIDSRYNPEMKWNCYPLSYLDKCVEIEEAEFQAAYTKVLNFFKCR